MASAVEPGMEETQPGDSRAVPARLRVTSTADPQLAELMESHPGPLLVIGERCPAGLFQPRRPPRGWAPPDLPEPRRRRLEELLLEGWSVYDAGAARIRARHGRAEGSGSRGSGGVASRRELTPPDLTPREHEVLDLVSQGWSNPEIARVLDISVHTVKYHLARLLERLEAANRAELVRRAAELGLLRV